MPRAFQSVLSLLFGLAFFSASNALAAEDRFKLTVTVVYANGQPVPNAAVTVTHDRIGPEVRPHDYRMETDTNGVATTEIIPGGVGEGVAYWPKLEIQAKKGARVANDSVKVVGTRLTSGVRYPDVARTLTITGDEETERTKVNIAVNVTDDSSAGVGSANISIKGPEGTYTGRTGADGKTNIPVPFLPKAEYWVSATKRGYEPKDRLVLLEASPSSSTVEAPLILKKSATPDGIVVSINVKQEGSPDPVREARILIRDMSKVVSDDYYITANTAGVARLRLPGPGTYPISIEHDSFEPVQSQLQLSAGEETKAFDFTLKEKLTESTLTITVLAGDIKNGRGSYQPIRGASVKAGPASGTTDREGKVTLNVKPGIAETTQGAGYAEAVDVTVSANGYKSATQSVRFTQKTLRSVPGSGAATIVLEVGEDEAEADTPIKLLVQVVDARNDPIQGATVEFHTASGNVSDDGGTPSDGKKLYYSGAKSAEQMAALRKGMDVTVKCTGYKDHRSTVPTKFLEPSTSAQTYTVQLEKDWTELARAIAGIEGRVGALRSEIRNQVTKGQSVKLLGAKSIAARGRVESWLNELKAARTAFETKLSGTKCEQAKELVKTIEALQKEAAEKEKTLRKLLDEAIGLAATCKTKAEGAVVAEKHRNAIKLAGEMGSIAPKASVANEKLKRFAEAMKDAGPLQTKLQETAVNIQKELETAKKEASTASSDFNDAYATNLNLPGKRAALQSDYAKLKASHKLAKDYGALPKDLAARLQNLDQTLGEGGADLSLTAAPAPDLSRIDDVIQPTLTQLEKSKVEADTIVADFKAAMCTVQPLDTVVSELGSLTTGTMIELGAAADLPARAQACGASASPSPTPTATPTPTPSPSPSATPTPSPSPSDEVIVPDVSGFKDVKAMKAAAGPDMVGKIIAVRDKPPDGQTTPFRNQLPVAKSKAPRNSTLQIFVYQSMLQAATPTPSPTATPARTGSMPNLIGLTLDQAVTRLSSNMRIGSDEIGDAPPTPEQALTIFYQNPPPNAQVDTTKPVVITVKRYGSAQSTLVQKFDGTYVGRYKGDDSGAVRFTVSGGSISIQTPGSGTGQVSAGGSANFSGAGRDGNSSYTFDGNFTVSPSGKATANGSWSGTQSGFTGSGTWSASRP